MTRNIRTNKTLRRVSALAAVAGTVLFVGGCGSGSGESKAAQPAAGKAPAAVAPAGVVLDVTGAEFTFAPVALKAAAGETTIRFVNKGVVEHDYSIEALKIHIIAPAGKTTDAKVTLKPGAYKSVCTVPGHLQSGMAGTLTVS